MVPVMSVIPTCALLASLLAGMGPAPPPTTRPVAAPSEFAEGMLGSVAGLKLGFSVLSYQEDPESGEFMVGFGSSTCPDPKASRKAVRRVQKEQNHAIRRELDVLAVCADADGSGDVSDREAIELQYLYVYGTSMAHWTGEKGYGLERIAKGKRMTVDELLAMGKKYESFRARLKTCWGVSLPEARLPETERPEAGIPKPVPSADATGRVPER